MQNVHLQIGIDVREEDNLRVALNVVEPRCEIREDIELRFARLRDVQVVAVLAGPEKCLRAFYSLQTVEVDIAAFENRDVFSVKSSPTTATRFTGAKNEAATAKYVAEPPRQRSAVPNGVVMRSNATLPTTRILIFLQALGVGR